MESTGNSAKQYIKIAYFYSHFPVESINIFMNSELEKKLVVDFRNQLAQKKSKNAKKGNVT